MLEQRPHDVFGESSDEGASVWSVPGSGEVFSIHSLKAYQHSEAGRRRQLETRSSVDLAADKKARRAAEALQTQETQERIWAATKAVSEAMRLEEEAQLGLAEV